MRAVVYERAGVFDVREIPPPVAGPEDVLVRTTLCGVCHTDLNVHHGEFFSSFPLTPGHEISGTVEAVGSAVTGVRAGDLVVADNTWTCGACHYCRRGLPLFCERFYSLGINGPGGMAELVRVHASKVFVVEGRLEPHQAVLVEPTACAVHGVDVIAPRQGDDVLIFGAGPAGLLLGQLLRHAGASRVVVAAPSEAKRRLAARLCADETVAMVRGDAEAHDAAVRGLAPRGFDIVVDCTGALPVLDQALRYVTSGGKLVVYGVPRFDDRVHWAPYEIFKRQIAVLGSFAQVHCFDRAIEALARGRVRVDGMITSTFGLESYGQALAAVEAGRDVKIVVQTRGR